MAQGFDSVGISIELAVDYHRAGKITQAERIYRSVLREHPDHIDANYLLGLIELDRGMCSSAARMIQKARDLAPTNPLYHYNLGRALEGEGNAGEAERSYRQALRLRKGYPEVHHALALLLQNAGRLDEAVEEYRRILKESPGLASVHNNLGNALHGLGRLAEAEGELRRTVELEPGYAQGWGNLGNLLHRMGKGTEAEQAFRKGLELAPQSAEIHYNYANLLQQYCSYDAAITHFRRAIELSPQLAGAWNNLGNIYKQQGKVQLAMEAFDQAIGIEPQGADPYNNKGNVLVSAGEIDAAIGLYRDAVRLNPGHKDAYSNLVYALNYPGGITEQEIFEQHREWSRRFERPILRKKGPPLRPLGGRRLRIGYLSADFRRHSVAFFFEPLIHAHHKERVETFLYSNVLQEDEVTERIRNAADHWRRIVDLGDEAAAQRIRDDAVDVLVDLSGHTDRNRLTILPYRPAPLQINWLGYPNTSGLECLDYRFTDAIADPPGESDRLHSERLHRLPAGFLCYQGYEDAPEISPPPSEQGGTITFGSFNNLTKVTRQVVEAWCAVLHAVPGSRMLLKTFQLEDQGMRLKYARWFDENGIGPERLELLARTPGLREHLEVYHRIDIALDTFPYNGTTTTCEALWMGVPVLTLDGTSHRARVSKDILQRIGLGELVAADREDLAQRAAALAADPPRLRGIRLGLRERMRQSPLCDADGFARQIEEACLGLMEGRLGQGG